MKPFLAYLARRLVQFAVVVFIGVNITYVITHSTPIDPVEQSVSAATSFGVTSPEAIEMMRASLRELYGLEGSPVEQYLSFWRRVFAGDFGPSLSAFPTPVSTLIWRAMPWTVGLLLVSTVMTWIIGNLIGGLAGYYRRNRLLKLVGIVSMGVHPIPYYIVAFVLLIVFGFLWPVLPISGGASMNANREDTFGFALDVLVHSVLPALSLMAVGIGGWFMGMRALVSNIVTEDYVGYAELAGVGRRRILGAYVMGNALGPQVTGLALQLGAIFNGAIITEQVFGYPGLGSLLISGVHAGDYSLVLGITSVSIIAVSVAALLIDLLFPLIDPRVETR
ncbi:ABC transporter permease [Inquilinus limosus]|uniref:ABC transporter permease n=1 Tax=Inquilinus limosus TaxID=171674 RepID=UPI003F153C1A